MCLEYTLISIGILFSSLCWGSRQMAEAYNTYTYTKERQENEKEEGTTSVGFTKDASNPCLCQEDIHH
jgi:archaellum component FlaF (FlaF/FlaG flagellin family)